MTTVVNLKSAPFDVYIGRANPRRGLKASKWQNPFVVGRDGTRDEVVEKFRQHLLSSAELLAAIPELKGKTLGCWCAPLACHGEVLAELADKANG